MFWSADFLFSRGQLKTPDDLTEIELAPVADSSPTLASASTTTSGASSGPSPKASVLAEKKARPRLKQLLPSFQDRLDESLKESSDADPFASTTEDRRLIQQTWTDPWSYGPNAEVQNRFASNSAFYQEVFRRVESHLEWDDLLAQYNHVGKVYLKFAVRPDGQLVGNSLSAEALDPILKVRSARALRKGLALPFDYAKRLQREEPLWMTARFFWVPKETCQNLQGVEGPYLSFCRNSGYKKLDVADAEEMDEAGAVVSETMDDALHYGAMAFTVGPFGLPEEIKKRRLQKWRQRSGHDPFEKDRQDPDYHL